MSSQKCNYLEVRTVLLGTNKSCPILYHILFKAALKVVILIVDRYHLFCFFQLIIFLYYRNLKELPNSEKLGIILRMLLFQQIKKAIFSSFQKERMTILKRK